MTPIVLPPIKVHVELSVDRQAQTDPRKQQLRRRVATVEVPVRVHRGAA